jgi:hypothetical protein
MLGIGFAIAPTVPQRLVPSRDSPGQQAASTRAKGNLRTRRLVNLPGTEYA